MTIGPDIETRIRVARGFLAPDATFDQPWGGFSRCPHAHLHTGGKSAPRECRVYLTGAPTIHCFHVSCQGPLAATNKELRRAVWEAEHGGAAPRPTRPKAMPRIPKPEKPKREIDVSKALRMASMVSAECGDEAWWMAASPLPPEAVNGEAFLDLVFQTGDRVMLTTAKRSTGDYIWVAGAPGRAYRLGKKPGVKAVPAPRLPKAGRGGVMFAINPVDGQWHPTGNIDPDTGMEKLGRRGKAAVVRYPHLLLETDALDGPTWLRVLAQLPLPIVCVIHTGGRGYHCIIRLPVEPRNLPEYEYWERNLAPVMTAAGADWQAMGVSKSSRLPGALRLPEDYAGDFSDADEYPRHRLIYLDPNPSPVPLIKSRGKQCPEKESTSR